jgi:hypothetical protein
MRTFILLLFVVKSFSIFASDSIPCRLIHISGSNYKDYEIVDNLIYAITLTDSLVVFDFTKDSIISFPSIEKTSCITKKDKQIYIGTEDGRVLLYDNQGYKWKDIAKTDEAIVELFVNSVNKVFAITSKGIYDFSLHKYFSNPLRPKSGMVVVQRKLFIFKKTVNHYWDLPKKTFLDYHDRIWCGYNSGEFGGGIIVFDTKKGIFIDNKLDSINKHVSSIQSIYGDSANVYVSCGLQHFIFFGDIIKFNNDLENKIIYDGKIDEDTTAVGVYVGPGQILNNAMVFFTHKGFHKVVKIDRNGKILKTEILFRPSLWWNREPLAIGSAMSVKRIDLIDKERFVFLTSNDGIGIYNGRNLLMIK